MDGWKFHTTTADNMTTDWVGPRLYRAELSELLKGALSPETDDVHYITDFRYPRQGGYIAFVQPFAASADVRLRHDVAGISVRERTLTFAGGRSERFDHLISSLPLPELVRRFDEAPLNVREAAAQLACRTRVIVNIGIDREDISPAHWTYFYDRDYSFSRLSFPHMFSEGNAPPGTGSIQAEVYFSTRYRPLDRPPEALIDVVVRDLRRCGLVRDTDRILLRHAHVAPYANVIFDLERPAALKCVRDYLAEVGIETCGRYGEWNYAWTDESFVSGERAAQQVLDRMTSAGVPPADGRG